MVLHDIEHFDDYLLAKLEQLEQRQTTPGSADGHTLPLVGGRARSSPSRAKPRLRTKPLPNLLENTLVARFKRVQVSPRRGRGEVGERAPTLGTLPGFVGARSALADTQHRPPISAWGVGPPTEDALSLLRGRNNRNRNAVSAPCARNSTDPEMDEARAAEERQRAADEARIQKAVDTVRQSRKKWITDRVTGVPRQFEFEKPHFKLVYDKSGQYRRKSSTFGDLQSAKSDDDDQSSSKDDKPKKPTKPEIPGFYGFPKEEHFIPREALSVQEAGVDWSLSPSNRRAAHAEDPVVPPKPPAHLRQRCRVSFPVTEALHREGTSITKIKAKTLRPGEMKVSKVWQQDTADPCVPPAHLARALRLDLPLPAAKEKAVRPSLSPYQIPMGQQHTQRAN